jgi:hypothetical protein
LLSTAPFADETRFDARLEDFNDIISLLREFITLKERHKAWLICNLSVRLSFSFDLGIISPLWPVSSRCRDPFIRREAINLLYLVRRREGVWSSVVTAMVIEKIMLIEERNLQDTREARDIPSAARIRLLDVQYDPGIVAKLEG